MIFKLVYNYLYKSHKNMKYVYMIITTLNLKNIFFLS